MRQASVDQRRRAQRALAASVGLHLAVLIAVSQTRWLTTLHSPRATTTVVWLSDWLPADEPIAVEMLETAEEVPEPLPAPAPPEPAPRLTEEAPATGDAAPTEEPSPPSTAEPATEHERPPVDWEAARRSAILRMREHRAKSEAYLTFAYPQPVEPRRWQSDDSSTTMAGVQIRREGPCVRSATSFLSRLVLPVDFCDWGTERRNAYITPEQLERIEILSSTTGGLQSP